ncbi:hypothetical protein [Nocardia sp. NPDC051981]|uniref:hypothetical protein n=1 Tax=Nocardia sp. NPDC051981 TaxID=3155417 RepID=UPI0034230A80
MPGLTPLALPDFAVLGALNLAGKALTIEGVAAGVSLPPSGPGNSLGQESIRRIIARLAARGLVESGTDESWQLTQRGRVLWAAKGKRFTL